MLVPLVWPILLGLLCPGNLHAAAAVSVTHQQEPLQDRHESNGPFDKAFDAYVEGILQTFRVPGLSIAVIDNGEVFSKGYGFATVEPRRNATADTQYFTGSTTKAFTAAAAAMLVHDDKNYPDIKWTSRINDIIREDFVLEDDYVTNHITLEDALSHRTGLPRHDFMYGQENETVRSVVQRIRHLPLSAELRTKWQYCNIMFGVVTDLIETALGRKLESFLEERIWKPLGMSSTTWTIPSDAGDNDSRLARGYYFDPEVCRHKDSPCFDAYVPEQYFDLLPLSGAGATISTVKDYALWMRAWLDAGEYRNTSSPITQRIYRDLLSPRSIVSEGYIITPPLYALAWITIDIFGEPLVSHGGNVPGFGTELFLLPESNYGVVTMGNTGASSNFIGGLIGVRLLLEKLGQGAADAEALMSTLERLPKPHLQSSTSRMRNNPTLSQLRVPIANEESGRLPHSLADFAGVYSHPAYGQVNLTIIRLEDTSAAALEGIPYPRTWPVKFRLIPRLGNVFTAHYFEGHGLGDIRSGKDIVWEEGGGAEAVFEFDPYGEEVRTMGIAIDGDMVEAAMEKGPEHWREAMIWFEKV